jgi:hypothetical protein
MQINILKVKLRDGMFATLEYEEVHEDNVKDQGGKTCNHPIHEDFKGRMQALGVHCILIDELVDIKKIKGDLEDYRPEILDCITVKGLSISTDDGQGVTISFERKLSTGKVINLNTPFTKFYDEACPYKFNTDLELSVNALLDEAKEYLAGNKFGVKQLTMDFPAKGGEDISNPL